MFDLLERCIPCGYPVTSYRFSDTAEQHFHTFKFALVFLNRIPDRLIDVKQFQYVFICIHFQLPPKLVKMVYGTVPFSDRVGVFDSFGDIVFCVLNRVC